MAFSSYEVEVKGKVTLRGTLAVPNGEGKTRPAILLIPGTGKLDRNGKVNKKLDLRLYKQLGEFLAEIGYVTLRYDKRGVSKSEGDFLRAGVWDFVSDAQAAVEYLKSREDVDADKIIVLGHSEGSMLGTAVAARTEIGGLILLAGAIETLPEALKRQREIAAHDIQQAKGFLGFILRLVGAHKKVEKDAQKFIDKVMKSNKQIARINFIPINAKWFRDHFNYNVRDDLAKVKCPVLAVTGAYDIQADPSVLKKLPEYVKGDASFTVVENMGHSCKYIEARSTAFSSKKDIVRESALPLHPELERVLKAWLEERFPVEASF